MAVGLIEQQPTMGREIDIMDRARARYLVDKLIDIAWFNGVYDISGQNSNEARLAHLNAIRDIVLNFLIDSTAGEHHRREWNPPKCDLRGGS